MLRYLTLGLALVLAAPAGAMIRTATYTGTITMGQHQLGPPESTISLAGLGYVARFRYDTSLGLRTTTADSDDITGGIVNGFNSPILDASLTIDGVTWHYLSNGEGRAYTSSYDAVQHSASGSAMIGSENVGTNLLLYAGPPGSPASLDGLYPHTAGAAIGVQIEFLFYRQDPLTGDSLEYLAGYGLGDDITSYAVTGVPEPASWALMIAGFGLVGAAMRRTRVAVPS